MSEQNVCDCCPENPAAGRNDDFVHNPLCATELSRYPKGRPCEYGLCKKTFGTHQYFCKGRDVAPKKGPCEYGDCIKSYGYHSEECEGLKFHMKIASPETYKDAERERCPAHGLGCADWCPKR